MLALKLLLVPVFLALISLAGKRWGASVAGWLAGFPLVAGPILLFLALERDVQFAEQAAISTLSAVAAAVVFSTSYAWCSQRWGWTASLVSALTAWFGTAFMLSLVVAKVNSALWFALAIAALSLLLAPSMFPRGNASDSAPLPKLELFMRMIAGAALVVCVTSIANLIGSAWSGLLALFPVLGSVLAVFSHRASGPRYVATVLRSMMIGMWSLVAFCFVLALCLPNMSIVSGFAIALSAALAVQLTVRLFLLRSS
jgi:uncharacterized membrane protein (GlpM family)